MKIGLTSLVLGFLCGAGCAGPVESVQPSAVAPLEGRALPSFTARDLATRTRVSLEAERGRVVLLDFWASWCVPCKQSIPFYSELLARHRDRGFTVVGVSVDDTIDLADRFVRETNPGFAMWFDEDKQVAERLALATMPTAFLIDRDGIVRRVHLGFVDDDRASIEAAIVELLASSAKDPVPTP